MRNNPQYTSAMRLRLIAPIIVMLALAGCSQASSADTSPTDSTSTESSANGSAASDDVKAIQEVATKFLQAAQIADWTTVCSVSVDKVGAAITGDAVKGCADNYLANTNSVEAWAKLTKEKQDQITADAKTISYVGTPTITGDKAATDTTWNFKGAVVNDGPALALVKIDGKWWVDSSNPPSASASPSPATS
jgi:nitrous oxide reductase accessory protein NosL